MKALIGWDSLEQYTDKDHLGNDGRPQTRAGQ